MTRRCAECKFYYDLEGECRRYAPKMDYPKKKWLDIHNSELLRDIAVAVHAIANMQTVDKDDDLNLEATECFEENWPRVLEDDWCGEFVEAVMAPNP